MFDMTPVTHIHRVPIDTLGARLLLLRHELGWSQRAAALATGVPYGTWQGMEDGRETRSLDRHIAAISNASGFDRDWLMWGGHLATPEGPHPDSDEGLGDATRQYHWKRKLTLVQSDQSDQSDAA